MALSHSYFNAVKGAAARCLPFPSLLRLNARTFAMLYPVHFCGHRAFTVCPLLWTPRFLLPVHFCGHRAFTACPLLWTPRFLLPVRFCGHLDFYCLSTFVDTALFTACPLLWTPRFLLPVHFCGHFPYTATQNSNIVEFL